MVMDRFGYDHHPMLDMPAKDDLGRTLLVFLGQVQQNGNIEIPLHQRTPSLDDNIVQLAEVADILLVHQGMQFDLVYRRNNIARIENILQMMDLEIAHSNRTYLSLFVELGHSPPSIQVFSFHRPMDQVQVEILEAQFLQTRP